VERINDRKGKGKYQPPPPALPRKTMTPTTTTNIEGVVAQQAQEPEREAKSQSPHSSTEPRQPLPRERTGGLSGESRDLEARNEATPATPTPPKPAPKTRGTQPKVVITRMTKEGGIQKLWKKLTREAAKTANENNKK
jgi:hypothetical protein